MTDITMGTGTFRLADVFSKSFAIYGRRFVPFIVLTAIGSIPSYLILFYLLLIGLNGPPSYPGELAGFMAEVVDMATKSLASGAVMYGAIQERDGRTFSVGDSVQIVLGRFLPIIVVASIVTMLGKILLAIPGLIFDNMDIVGLGMILLIVPALILTCMWIVASPVCVVERAGVFTSMSRSSFLTKGYRWQVLGMFLLMQVITAIAVPIFATFSWTGPTIGSIAGLALSAIIGAFNDVLIGVLYFELRAVSDLRMGVPS
jgi:hypothetical protein